MAWHYKAPLVMLTNQNAIGQHGMHAPPHIPLTCCGGHHDIISGAYDYPTCQVHQCENISIITRNEKQRKSSSEITVRKSPSNVLTFSPTIIADCTRNSISRKKSRKGRKRIKRVALSFAPITMSDSTKSMYSRSGIKTFPGTISERSFNRGNSPVCSRTKVFLCSCQADVSSDDPMSSTPCDDGDIKIMTKKRRPRNNVRISLSSSIRKVNNDTSRTSALNNSRKIDTDNNDVISEMNFNEQIVETSERIQPLCDNENILEPSNTIYGNDRENKDTKARKRHSQRKHNKTYTVSDEDENPVGEEVMAVTNLDEAYCENSDIPSDDVTFDDDDGVCLSDESGDFILYSQNDKKDDSFIHINLSDIKVDPPEEMGFARENDYDNKNINNNSKLLKIKILGDNKVKDNRGQNINVNDKTRENIEMDFMGQNHEQNNINSDNEINVNSGNESNIDQNSEENREIISEKRNIINLNEKNREQKKNIEQNGERSREHNGERDRERNIDSPTKQTTKLKRNRAFRAKGSVKHLEFKRKQKHEENNYYFEIRPREELNNNELLTSPVATGDVIDSKDTTVMTKQQYIKNADGMMIDNKVDGKEAGNDEGIGGNNNLVYIRNDSEDFERTNKDGNAYSKEQPAEDRFSQIIMDGTVKAVLPLSWSIKFKVRTGRASQPAYSEESDEERERECQRRRKWTDGRRSRIPVKEERKYYNPKDKNNGSFDCMDMRPGDRLFEEKGTQMRPNMIARDERFFKESIKTRSGLASRMDSDLLITDVTNSDEYESTALTNDVTAIADDRCENNKLSDDDSASKSSQLFVSIEHDDEADINKNITSPCNNIALLDCNSASPPNNGMASPMDNNNDKNNDNTKVVVNHSNSSCEEEVLTLMKEFKETFSHYKFLLEQSCEKSKRVETKPREERDKKETSENQEEDEREIVGALCPNKSFELLESSIQDLMMHNDQIREALERGTHILASNGGSAGRGNADIPTLGKAITTGLDDTLRACVDELEQSEMKNKKEKETDGDETKEVLICEEIPVTPRLIQDPSSVDLCCLSKTTADEIISIVMHSENNSLHDSNMPGETKFAENIIADKNALCDNSSMTDEIISTKPVMHSVNIYENNALPDSNMFDIRIDSNDSSDSSELNELTASSILRNPLSQSKHQDVSLQSRRTIEYLNTTKDYLLEAERLVVPVSTPVDDILEEQDERDNITYEIMEEMDYSDGRDELSSEQTRQNADLHVYLKQKIIEARHNRYSTHLRENFREDSLDDDDNNDDHRIEELHANDKGSFPSIGTHTVTFNTDNVINDDDVLSSSNQLTINYLKPYSTGRVSKIPRSYSRPIISQAVQFRRESLEESSKASPASLRRSKYEYDFHGRRILQRDGLEIAVRYTEMDFVFQLFRIYSQRDLLPFEQRSNGRSYFLLVFTNIIISFLIVKNVSIKI